MDLSSENHPRASARLKLGVLALLLAVTGLRVASVLQGGQFLFPDEGRYHVSREAAALIAEGKWHEGLALPFEGGDHAGFKLLGILPAWVERRTVQAAWVPGLFFALFSVGVVLLIGGLARRLGGSREAQGWSALAAATSTTLFCYARHLLPYDAAMCFALAALYVGTGSRALWRSYAGGLLAGSAFAIYYGYWPLVGVVLVWLSLHGANVWWRPVVRGLGAGLGALTVVAAAWQINRSWGTNQLFERARTFSRTINQGDYHAGLTTWDYLLRAEGLWIAVAVALSAVAVRQWWRSAPRERAAAVPGACAVATALAIWILFIVTGDLLHKFTVYGRLIRQMVPFLSLGLGFGAGAWLAARPRAFRAGLAVVLILNAAWLMGQALRIRFPDSFRLQWEPWIAARQGDTALPDAYYRFVNVTRYIHEIEVLRVPPAETVAVAAHAFSFEPYLFELFAAGERRRRREADHRMRVVKVAVPAAARVQGAPYGSISMQVRFNPAPAGVGEPLLSVGTHQAGELFFVQYLGNGVGRFGCEIMGLATIYSEPMTLDPTRAYEITCFSSSLLPPESDRALIWTEARQQGVRNQLLLAVDGRPVIQRLLAVSRESPGQAYAGANPIGADSARVEFTGEVGAVRRGGFPAPFIPESAVAASYGAVRMMISPPTSRSSRPEPLAVLGDPGRAVLGFVIPLTDGRAQFGAEIWGYGAPHGEPVVLRDAEANEVIYEFGSLFPPEGSGDWGDLPAAIQAKRKQNLRIWVNGALVLDTAVKTPEMGPVVVLTGENPIGGSYVGQTYTGKVLSAERLPLSESPAEPSH